MHRQISLKKTPNKIPNVILLSGILLSFLLVLGSGILYFHLPPYYFLLLFFTGLFAFIIIRKPRWILYPLLVSFFIPMKIFGLVTFFQIIGFISLICLLILIFVYKGKFITGNFFLPLLIFLVYIPMTLLWVRYPDLTVNEIYKFFVAILIYIILINLVENRRQFLHVLGIIALMASVNSLYAIFQYIFRKSELYRATGFWQDPNDFSVLPIVTLPLVFYPFLYSKGLAKKLIFILLTMIMIGGVLVSESRGATIAMIFIFLFLFLKEWKKVKEGIVLTILIVILLSLLPTYLFQRYESIDEDLKKSVGIAESPKLIHRGYINKTAWKIWKEYPFLGVGPGNFRGYFASTEYNPGWELGHQFYNHNLFMQILAENGLFGALWFLWIVSIMYFNFKKIRSKISSPQDALLRNIAIGMILAFMFRAISLIDLYSQEFLFIVTINFLAFKILYLENEEQLQDA